MAFSLSYVSCCNLSTTPPQKKYIFRIQRAGDMPWEFSSKELLSRGGGGLFTLFSTVSWMGAFLFSSVFVLILPYLPPPAPPLAFKHDPASRALALWGVTARSGCRGRPRGLARKALHSAVCGRGFFLGGGNLDSLHPHTVPRIQELPSFCWAGMKVQDCREEGREKTEEGGKKKTAFFNFRDLNCTHAHTQSQPFY